MKISFREIDGNSPGYWGLLGVLVLVVIAGLLSALQMEHYGHIVTGMNNHIVWGMPHVFAVFLIVAASGALNVPSPASKRTRCSTSHHRWRTSTCSPPTAR